MAEVCVPDSRLWCAKAALVLLVSQINLNITFYAVLDDDWLIGTSLSSYHEKATVRYALDESAPA